MKKGMVLLLSVAAIVLASFTASAAEFSAIMTHATREGVSEGTIYVSNDKVFIRSYDWTMIIRQDMKMMWTFYPVTKRYREKPFNPLYIVATSTRAPGEESRTSVGRGKVGDKVLSKYQVVFSVDGKRNTVYQWFDEGSDIPVKTVTQDGSWSIEFKNINVGQQSYDMFEIPKDYKEETSTGSSSGD